LARATRAAASGTATQHAEQERLASERQQASSVSPVAPNGITGTPSDGPGKQDEARRKQAEIASTQSDARAKADRERFATQVKDLQAEKARLVVSKAPTPAMIGAALTVPERGAADLRRIRHGWLKGRGRGRISRRVGSLA